MDPAPCCTPGAGSTEQAAQQGAVLCKIANKAIAAVLAFH